MTDQTNRESWLNGWHRQGGSVLMGTAWHCAGCGKFLGLGCVALDDESWPEKKPDFPFEETTCPLCELRHTPDPPDAVDKLTERLERLRERESAAIEDEREVCAKIAEGEVRPVSGNLSIAGVDQLGMVALKIAEQIRARGAEKEAKKK